MTQPTTKQPKKLHLGKLTISLKAIIISCLVIISVLLAFYLYNYSFLSPRNYAQEVAEPIEQALVKAGAVKVCSQGDYGRGVDNRRPWYSVVFEINGDSDLAINKIKAATTSAGYSLQDEVPPSGASQGTKDFIDNSSKSSQYWDLESGKVELGFEVYSDRTYSNESAMVCVIRDKNASKGGVTTFSLSADLPSFKH